MRPSPRRARGVTRSACTRPGKGATPLDLPAALDVAVSRPAVPVDLGRIGDRVFINVATGGFGTQVTVETPEPLKKTLGGAALMDEIHEEFNEEFGTEFQFALRPKEKQAN